MGLITNLFSVFDPSTRLGLRLNWRVMVLGLLALPLVKRLQGSRWRVAISMVFWRLAQELVALLSPKMKSGSAVFIALFLFIGLSNRAGLFPYLFTSSRHLAVRLGLALPLWMGGVLLGWVVSPKKALAHLVPSGTPPTLMPFIVVIERVRILIRPGTLAVRLAANIIAGHLLLALLGGSLNPQRGLTRIIVLRTQAILVLLELAVALIQAYVFMTLRALYAREN